MQPAVAAPRTSDARGCSHHFACVVCKGAVHCQNWIYKAAVLLTLALARKNDDSHSVTAAGLLLPSPVHAVLPEELSRRGRLIIVGDVHGCSAELQDLMDKCACSDCMLQLLRPHTVTQSAVARMRSHWQCTNVCTASACMYSETPPKCSAPALELLLKTATFSRLHRARQLSLDPLMPVHSRMAHHSPRTHALWLALGAQTTASPAAIQDPSWL